MPDLYEQANPREQADPCEQARLYMTANLHGGEVINLHHLCFLRQADFRCQPLMVKTAVAATQTLHGPVSFSTFALRRYIERQRLPASQKLCTLFTQALAMPRQVAMQFERRGSMVKSRALHSDTQDVCASSQPLASVQAAQLPDCSARAIPTTVQLTSKTVKRRVFTVTSKTMHGAMRR